MLELSLIFQSGMVLQREKPVPIWGCCTPGAEVTVSFLDQERRTVGDTAGHFQATLDPLPVCFGGTMTARCGGEEIVLTDVQVGEVWLAGGQSNMEFYLRYDQDLPDAKEHPNSSIRFFDYPKVSYPGQIERANYLEYYGFWRKAVPEEVERFSAVGYWFANWLWERYSVPVGIIGCNWGGTPAAAWMDEAHIRIGGGKVWLDDYAEQTKTLDMIAYKAAYEADPRTCQTDLFANPVSELLLYGVPFEKLGNHGFRREDLSPAEIAGVMGPFHECRPAGLRYSMLEPLIPYAIRGFLWYQGETDGDLHPETYRTLFPALIANWRELWGEALPFLFVQLAPFVRWGNSAGRSYPIIRRAQQETAKTVAHTGMAVITDAGAALNIHPRNKKPVGERLALLAEKVAYGEDVLCEAPTLIRAEVHKGRVTLYFENTGEGLTLRGTVLSGVQIFQDGRKLTDLAAAACGDTVVITGEQIEDAPAEVRLAEMDWYEVNLYNSSGLPARPAAVICEHGGTL